MLENNNENSKKITITLDENITQVPTYKLFLIRGTTDYMEVQLAKMTETDTEINVLVESVFRIDKESVPQFARQFLRYLQDVDSKQESQDQQDV